jgi:hypothetical protein
VLWPFRRGISGSEMVFLPVSRRDVAAKVVGLWLRVGRYLAFESWDFVSLFHFNSVTVILPSTPLGRASLVI